MCRPPGPSPPRRARRTSRRTRARAAGRRRTDGVRSRAAPPVRAAPMSVRRSGTAIAARVVVAFVVGGGDPAPRPDGQRCRRRASARAQTRARARRRRSAEPTSTDANRASGGSVRLVPKNSTARLPCSLARSNKRPHELFCGVDLGALGVAGAHRFSAERAPLNSRLLAQPGALPARSPARRAEDE